MVDKKHYCDICGTEENIHGHHPDYSKPLDVIWLCKSHHDKLHKWLREKVGGL